MAIPKLEGPTTCLTLLGIEIDTQALEIRLPNDKLQALQELIRSWLGRESCGKRELESLIGSLSHACCVVRSGKTFLRRLFQLLAVARKAHHNLRLNKSYRSDLFWWHAFLAPHSSVRLATSHRNLRCIPMHRVVLAVGQFGPLGGSKSNGVVQPWPIGQNLEQIALHSRSCYRSYGL